MFNIPLGFENGKVANLSKVPGGMFRDARFVGAAPYRVGLWLKKTGNDRRSSLHREVQPFLVRQARHPLHRQPLSNHAHATPL